jgi:hypothetical protein
VSFPIPIISIGQQESGRTAVVGGLSDISELAPDGQLDYQAGISMRLGLVRISAELRYTAVD